MNPSQSESFWKSLQQDEMQKWRTPPDAKSNNSLSFPRKEPSQKQSSPHLPRSSYPSSRLQTYYQMRSEKEEGFQWNSDREEQLFDLHRHYGNKWSSIGARLGCPNDNCVKNKYYSTMRKGYRKLNKYITLIRRKRSAPHLSCNKLIKPEFLVKLNAVVDGTYLEKYEVKGTAIDCSQEIQRKLIELARSSTVYEGNSEGEFVLQEGLLKEVQEFSRGCKKRKGKRKQRGEEEEEDNESEQGEKQEIAPKIQIVASEKKKMEVLSSSLARTAIVTKKNTDLPDEKSSRNQEVQFPDNLLVDEQKQEKQGKADTHPFKFDLQLSRNQLEKSTPNYRHFIDPTPTINSTHRFQQQAKYFQDQTYLKISLSSMNSTYFKAKECPEPVGSFVQSIPQLKDSDKTLYDSVNIKREIEEQSDMEKIQCYNRTRSSNLTNRGIIVDLLHPKSVFLQVQKEEKKDQ